MSKFAIVGIGGKQFQVTAGENILVEKIADETGKTVKLNHVFLIAEGEDVKLGQPLVKDAYVEAKVLEVGKADKIRVFKMKHRKRYRIDRGHRQPFAKLEIIAIHG